MSETGDFELFGAPAAKEHDEKSDEKFREEMKKTQKAMAQLQKEEGQAKANDDHLARIIVRFLGQSGNTDLFLLISRTVAQNIPSELILAIISLVNHEASEEIKHFLKAAESSGTETSALTVTQSQNFSSLTPEQEKKINEWIKTINEVASKKPHRNLENLIIKKQENGHIIREVAPVVIQLSAFILRNYLSQQNIAFEFEKLHEFMQTVFVKLVKDLESLVKEQKNLRS